jgi:hypothetical protein
MQAQRRRACGTCLREELDRARQRGRARHQHRAPRAAHQPPHRRRALGVEALERVRLVGDDEAGAEGRQRGLNLGHQVVAHDGDAGRAGGGLQRGQLAGRRRQGGGGEGGGQKRGRLGRAVQKKRQAKTWGSLVASGRRRKMSSCVSIGAQAAGAASSARTRPSVSSARRAPAGRSPGGSHSCTAAAHTARTEAGATMSSGQSSAWQAATHSACAVLPSPISSPSRKRAPRESPNRTPSCWNGYRRAQRPGGSRARRASTSSCGVRWARGGQPGLGLGEAPAPPAKRRRVWGGMGLTRVGMGASSWRARATSSWCARGKSHSLCSGAQRARAGDGSWRCLRR